MHRGDLCEWEVRNGERPQGLDVQRYVLQTESNPVRVAFELDEKSFVDVRVLVDADACDVVQERWSRQDSVGDAMSVAVDAEPQVHRRGARKDKGGHEGLRDSHIHLVDGEMCQALERCRTRWEFGQGHAETSMEIENLQGGYSV